MVLAVLALLLFFGIAGWLGKELADNARTRGWVDHTSLVIDTIGEVRSTCCAQLYSHNFPADATRVTPPSRRTSSWPPKRFWTSAPTAAEDLDQIRRIDAAIVLAEQILATNDRIVAAVQQGMSTALGTSSPERFDEAPAFRTIIEEAYRPKGRCWLSARRRRETTLRRIMWLLAGIAVLAFCAGCWRPGLWRARSRPITALSGDGARQAGERCWRPRSGGKPRAAAGRARQRPRRRFSSSTRTAGSRANRACGEAFGVPSQDLLGSDVAGLVPALAGGERPRGEVK